MRNVLASILTAARDLGFAGIALGDPAAALRYAQENTAAGDAIVVTGSLFLVSQLRHML